MKKHIVLIILWLFFGSEIVAQGYGVNTRVLSRPKVDKCRFENKPVSEVKPSNCNLESSCNFLFPVLVEDFDNNYDLPNKWSFTINGGRTNVLEVDDPLLVWYGDAYWAGGIETNPNITNHNLQLNNGIMSLITKVESPPLTRDNKSVGATSGAITALSRFRTGVFEARIKIPSANKLWPALWLLNNSGNYAEIDIFEFYDNNIGSNGPGGNNTPGTNSNCDTYNLHRMTLHSGNVNDPIKHDYACQRDDKYPLDINQWHTYKLVWDEYQTSIFVDGQLRGFASKYYRGSTLPFFPCQYGSSYHYFDAAVNFDCNTLLNEPNNLTIGPPNINWGPRPSWLPNWLPWPPPQPSGPNISTNIPNRVDESVYFPNKNNAMSFILNNGMNKKYKGYDYSGFSTASMTMEVDWIRISQPFCCGVNKTVCDLPDLDNQTYETDILTGQKLTIGNNNNTCTFVQHHPGDYFPGTTSRNYRDRPVVLLATDEIEINGNAEFPGDTYAEMRITSCGSQNRIANDEKEKLNTFFESQQQMADSLNSLVSDSLFNIYKSNYLDSLASTYNAKDACIIKISPNPTQNFFNLDLSDWCFENIISLQLIDINGREFILEKSNHINVEKYAKGTYLVKILMKDGTLLIEKIIKI